MGNAQWTRIAREELDNIAWQIGIHSGRPKVADKLVDDISAKVEQYGRQPEMGSVHPDLPKVVRVFHHKRYAVIYEPTTDGIAVLRVIDATRDFQRVWNSSAREN